MDFNKSNVFIHFLQKGLFATDYSDRGGYNFCDLCKNVAGVATITFILFYIAGWFLVFGIPPWLLYFFADGFPNPFSTDSSYGINIHTAPLILLLGSAAVTIVGGMAWADPKVKEWRDRRALRRRLEDKPLGFPYKTPWYKEVYQGFKDKYCPLVYIIDDSKED